MGGLGARGAGVRRRVWRDVRWRGGLAAGGGLVEGGEVGGADRGDFTAELEVHAQELVGVDQDGLAREEGAFDVEEDFAQPLPLGQEGGEDFVVEGFEMHGAGGADVRVELAVPLDEGALGDVDVGGDVRQAEALGPKLDKLIFSFICMHRSRFSMAGGTGPNAPLALLALWVVCCRRGGL